MKKIIIAIILIVLAFLLIVSFQKNFMVTKFCDAPARTDHGIITVHQTGQVSVNFWKMLTSGEGVNDCSGFMVF